MKTSVVKYGARGPDGRTRGHEFMSVVIIGSGFAGLCAAIQLKRAGVAFTILERAADVGGTWRDNDYPGCACDVQSHLYSFSFEPNPGWTRMFADQREIFEYLRRCADKYGIRQHIRFGENVTRADYDDAKRSWTVRTESGEQYEAPVLVRAMGALSTPSYPKVAGMERFEGKRFHSAQWDHGYDMNGKRVAVIGTGASAIQFVPRIAPQVARLDLYQRTPPWILPKPDRGITALERALFRRFPCLAADGPWGALRLARDPRARHGSRSKAHEARRAIRSPAHPAPDGLARASPQGHA